MFEQPNPAHNISYPARPAAVVFGGHLSARFPCPTGQEIACNPPKRVASYVMGKGEKSEDAENKQHFNCILCGDNFVMRRINTILEAQIAEKEKYVFIQ
jgi:hypothetical protein